MAFNGLWLEYELEGSSNYIAWKDRMEAVFEDDGLKGFISSDVPKPTSMDATLLDAWQKKVAKTRRKVRETILSQAFMVKPLHLQCGRL